MNRTEYYADILVRLIGIWHLYVTRVISLRLTTKLPTHEKATLLGGDKAI